METVIWLIGLGLPVAVIIFFFGWFAGSEADFHISNWGIGFDDGWKAHKEYVIKQAEKELEAE